jgi:hypothetical protein
MAAGVMVVLFSASLSANSTFHATGNDIDGNLDATVHNQACELAVQLRRWFIFLERFDRGQPVDMIIGSGPYTNANSGITGPHNPSLGTTMFEVTGITGLSSSTVVGNVVVSFGASPYGYSSHVVCVGNNCGGNESSVLEPATLVLTGLGLLGLGVFGRRLRKSK